MYLNRHGDIYIYIAQNDIFCDPFKSILPFLERKLELRWTSENLKNKQMVVEWRPMTFFHF